MAINIATNGNALIIGGNYYQRANIALETSGTNVSVTHYGTPIIDNVSISNITVEGEPVANTTDLQDYFVANVFQVG